MLFLRLTRADLPALAPHRARVGWLLCEDDDALWLRCPENDAANAAAVPCLERLRDDSRGLLVPLNREVPVARAPAGPWLPLTEWLPLLPPPARMPGKVESRAEARLIRSSVPREQEAILIDIASLARWAEDAPRVRLERLRFAAAEDGRAFVRGTPPPPVPGAAYYFLGDLALPCGWDFADHLLPAWVEKSLALPRGASAIFHPDGRVEQIDSESFLPLTLGAARRTATGSVPAA